MKIDFATLAFGYNIKVGGATPNWATALGQGKEHKINNFSEINEILKGMTYSAVSLEKVTTKIGKGGAVVAGNVEDSPIILASVFPKVYVNDILINNGKYILLITRDTSKSHEGRLRLKYGPSNTYINNGESYSNFDFIQQMKSQLGMAEEACWFVSDISVIDQNELALKVIIVNALGMEEYEDTAELHNAWEELEPSIVENPLFCNKEKNRIVFGAPGTGKSFRLDRDSKVFEDRMERVTFHPNYSYAQFVGTYKPVQREDGSINYEYVPGPFLRIYVQAVNHPEKQYLLLIEEINRANIAAVFGDVFQLLDRNEGTSDYPIAVSEDIKKYLFKHIKNCKGKSWEELSEKDKQNCLFMGIPSNMFLWATMNSADQEVFPMDTAFKRRWEFEYIGIDEGRENVINYVIPVGMKDKRHYIHWNELREGINAVLSKEENRVNEDKLLGPFFISKSVLDDISKSLGDTKAEDAFVKSFESKVIMYLFEDVMKMRPEKIFVGCKGSKIFSKICELFETDGEKIFGLNDIEAVQIDTKLETIEE